jgi:DNA-binding transcriptional MerR regulator/quercetin dioxygenase-like cupin family protein
MDLGKAASANKRGAASDGLMRIGDVARFVGISPSVLRSWESLGLVRPERAPNGYRGYTSEQIKLLKRARFLRRTRGLNAPAILHLLKSQGVLTTTSHASGALGPRLRSLRLSRGLSLAQVAASVGMSVGFLSSLERGQMTASVATLRKLARFYDIQILALFNPTDNNPRLVRPAQRKMLEAGPGVKMELLAWGNTVLEPHLFRIASGAGSGESYAHEGEEFLHMLRGQLEIILDDGEKYHLRTGDSFCFESHTSHRWVNPGKGEAWVLWVNSPPTF